MKELATVFVVAAIAVGLIEGVSFVGRAASSHEQSSLQSEKEMNDQSNLTISNRQKASEEVTEYAE